MEDNSDQNELWALLGAEAEEGEPSVPPRVAGLSQQPGFGDRMARRLASGVIPLFLAGLLPGMFFAVLHDWSGMGLTAVMVLLLSWLVSPLVRTGGFTSTWRLALLFFPLGVCVATFGLLPLPLISGPVEEAAYIYQMALTTLLGRPGVPILIGVILLIGLPAHFARRAYPWIRVQPDGPARKLLALVVLISPYLIYGAMWAESAPSKESLAWKARVEASLPLTPSSAANEWYDLYSKRNLIALDEDKAKKRGELRELALQMIAQSRKGMPASIEEAEYVISAMSGLLPRESVRLSEDERAELACLFSHCNLLSRPSDGGGAGAGVLLFHVFPRLFTTPDISPWRSRLRELEGLVCESAIEELDQNVWLYFFNQPAPEPEIFGTVQGAPKRRKVYLDPAAQLKQRPARSAEPMEIWGRETEVSPTLLLERRVQNRELEKWMRLRAQLMSTAPNDPWPELQKLYMQQDPLAPGDPLYMELGDRSCRDRALPCLQTAELILDLREQDVPHLTPEQAKRWNLEKVKTGWRLSLKGNPYYLDDSWVIR